MTVVGTAQNADEALVQMSRCSADIVLMDIDMPGMSCFEAIRQLHTLQPNAKVVILSAFVQDRFLEEALRSGAYAYLTKRESPESVIGVIRTVASGAMCFSAEVQSRILPDASGCRRLRIRSRSSTLTRRELEVLGCMARGLSKTEVATTMSLTAKTVHHHMTRVMQKLDIHDQAGLVRFALREGIATLEPAKDQHTPESPSSTSGVIRNAAPEMPSPEQRPSAESRLPRPEPITSAMAEIVGGFCHDLANTLAATLLALDSPAVHTPTIKASLLNADRAVTDLHRFLRQYYRTGSEPESPIEPEALTHCLREMILPVLRQSRISLRVDTSRVDTAFVIPRLLLRYLVLPLVTNSAESVRESPQPQQRSAITVTLTALAIDRVLRIVVSDTGPGWPAPYIDLDRQMRAGRCNSTKGDTRGYGLPNLHRLVSKLGGSMELSKRAKGGTRVRISVPWTR